MRRTGTGSDYDIVIVGGGMIGCSLALAVAPLGLRVAVIEPVLPSATVQPSFDDRSTALSRSTQRMLEAMGLWEAVHIAATPIRRIHVSDRGRFGFAHIGADEQGVDALGYVVINRVLGRILHSALAGMAGLDLRCPAQVTGIRLGPDVATAVVHGEQDGQSELRGRLLVAADGANSVVRDMIGISVLRTEYRQHAIVGNLQTEKPLGQCAFERFTEHGPLAVLPVGEDCAAFVWTVPDHDAGRVLELEEAAFLAELQTAFGYRLGQFSRVGKRAAYPLRLSKASRLTGHRAVLVGNAAHGLHPVAAQGFNLGMRDVAALADCIADALHRDGSEFDAGNRAILGRYAKWRRSDQRTLVGLTDGLVRLFGHTSPRVAMLRNIGMFGFDFVPGVRSLFARQMMGLAGRLPRLSRGVPLA